MKEEKQEKITIETLAQEMRQGFKTVNIRLDKMNEFMHDGFDAMGEKMDAIETRLTSQVNGVSNRIDFISLHYPNRMEHEQVVKRVDVIEKKLATHEKK